MSHLTPLTYDPCNPRSNMKAYNVKSPCFGCSERCIKTISEAMPNGETHSRVIRCHDTCYRYIAYDKEVTRIKRNIQAEKFKVGLTFLRPEAKKQYMSLRFPEDKKWYEESEKSAR